MKQIPIALQPGTKFLRLIRESDGWRIWIHANRTFTAGTYLYLYNTGAIDRVTVTDDDEIEQIFQVKGPDK